MPTCFAKTANGFNIAFDIQGSGPALLLLHGFSYGRSLWRGAGWVERLQPDFTVITMDLRGCGESTGSTDPADYSLENHLADVETVLETCGVQATRLWGWSLGGTIGLHLAAHSNRVIRALIAGTYFGRIFNEAYVNKWLAALEPLAQAQTGDRLAQSSYPSTEKRAPVKPPQPLVDIARSKGMLGWPGIQPDDVKIPTLIYSGTRDGNVVVQLERQREAIASAGLELCVLEGLDHGQLIHATDRVWPLASQFLQI